MRHTLFIVNYTCCASVQCNTKYLSVILISGAIHRHYESLKRSNREASAIGQELHIVNDNKKKRLKCSRRHRVSFFKKHPSAYCLYDLLTWCL